MERPELTEEEQREAIEHRDVVLHTRAVLATTSGRELFKYFFKEFQVGEIPAIGLPQEFIREMLGHLRAGQAIFELASEADYEQAGTLLARKEKDRYDQKVAEQNTARQSR
jgi:hypothetical protein